MNKPYFFNLHKFVLSTAYARNRIYWIIATEHWACSEKLNKFCFIQLRFSRARNFMLDSERKSQTILAKHWLNLLTFSPAFWKEKLFLLKLYKHSLVFILTKTKDIFVCSFSSLDLLWKIFYATYWANCHCWKLPNIVKCNLTICSHWLSFQNKKPSLKRLLCNSNLLWQIFNVTLGKISLLKMAKYYTKNSHLLTLWTDGIWTLGGGGKVHTNPLSYDGSLVELSKFQNVWKLKFATLSKNKRKYNNQQKFSSCCSKQKYFLCLVKLGQFFTAL